MFWWISFQFLPWFVVVWPTQKIWPAATQVIVATLQPCFNSDLEAQVDRYRQICCGALKRVTSYDQVHPLKCGEFRLPKCYQKVGCSAGCLRKQTTCYLRRRGIKHHITKAQTGTLLSRRCPLFWPLTIYVFCPCYQQFDFAHGDWCENCWWVPSNSNPIKMTRDPSCCFVVPWIGSQFLEVADASFGKDCTIEAHMSRALQMQTQVRDTNGHHSRLD